MKVYRIEGAFLGECTYFAVKGNDCLVIDPGARGDRITEFCAEHGWNIRAVLLTHGHLDHVFGLPELLKKGYPVYLHKEEVGILNGRANLALAFGIAFEKVEKYTAFEGERQVLPLAPFSVEAIYTPGHTSGSVCYYTEGVLFTGDTLFAGSYGRSDLPTGDEQDLLCSIANELFELPADTGVYAGHADRFADTEECAPDTTIGAERESNPILDLL